MKIVEVPGEFNLFVCDLFETTDLLLAQWVDKRLNPRVRRIVRHLAIELDHANAKAVITSIHREKTTDSGVHAAWRAVDLRETTKRLLSQRIRDEINHWFPYDEHRPHLDTIPRLDHGDGPHFHVQVRS